MAVSEDSFFKTMAKSENPAKEIEELCGIASEEAEKTKQCAQESIRGKFEYRPHLERFEKLKEAHEHRNIMNESITKARVMLQELEKEGEKDDVLSAETVILSSSLDVKQANQLYDDAFQGLEKGLKEIEEFYGSKKIKQISKILEDLDSVRD